MGPNYTRMELHDPAAVEPAKKKVSEIAERLRGQGGGLISIFYHPCEWVHREFWDGVNFARGANPPREQWKAPGQRGAEDTEGAFKRFAEYVDHIASIPGVRWITASELPVRYPDRVRREGVSAAELTELVRRINKTHSTGLDFQVIGGQAFSLADQFELLTFAVSELLDARPVKFPVRLSGLLGPDRSPPQAVGFTNVNWPAFRQALRDTRDFVQKEHRVPARVFIGAEPVAPGNFLVALAAAWTWSEQQRKQISDQSIPIGHEVAVLPEQHIAKDTPELFGGWIIHKVGFRAPQLLELARLQAWTLKPAIRREE
jgi:hypothetical protein